jgi:hypothetical protein
MIVRQAIRHMYDILVMVVKEARGSRSRSVSASTSHWYAHVGSLEGWENTEVLNKCYGGIPEHIKAQIARSIHVRFDTIDLNTTANVVYRSSFNPTIVRFKNNHIVDFCWFVDQTYQKKSLRNASSPSSWHFKSKY